MHDYQKARQKFRFATRFNPFDTELSLAAQYSIKDAAMYIPIDEDNQLNIFVYKSRGKEPQLDIRIFRKVKGKWIPTQKGIRIPAYLVTQLVNRLKFMEKKYGRNE